MKNDTEPQEPWQRAKHNPFYLPRHLDSLRADYSAMERFHVDNVRAHRAMKVLAGLDTPEAKRLYAELHRAGALHPRRTPSIPVTAFIDERAA